MVIFTVQKECHKTLRKKFLRQKRVMKADYPLHCINSIVKEFQKGKKYKYENFIMPPSLFEIAKTFILIEIPYRELN